MSVFEQKWDDLNDKDAGVDLVKVDVFKYLMSII